MEDDFIHLDLLAFVNVDSKLRSVGKQRVRLLIHADVHVQKALVHVMISNAFGGHRQNVVVEDSPRQQVDLALHRLLLRAVDPGDAVPGQAREFLDPNDEVDVTVAHFGHLDLNVGEQILGPQPRDCTANVVAWNFNLLPHLQ